MKHHVPDKQQSALQAPSLATLLCCNLHTWHLSCSFNICFCLRAFALAMLPAWSSSFRYPNGSLHFLQVSAQMSLFPTTLIKVLLPYLVHMSLPLHPHLLSVWSYCCSVTQSCPAPCDPMDCSTPGLPVHHQLPELAQTHVHWVGDAIQPSHPLLSLSPPTFSLSQHQGLFQWVNSSHQVAKSMGASASTSVLPMKIWIDFFWDWLVLSPCSPRDSQETSPAPQFESINFLALSLLYGPSLTSIHDYWKNHSFD